MDLSLRSRARRRAVIAGLALLAGFFAAAPAVAQRAPGASTGRLVGRILDAETGAPISGAQVVVAGTGVGALSGVDGRYTIAQVPVGTQAITVICLGYGDKTVEGLEVVAGQTAAQDVTLSSAAIELEGITVSAARETGSVGAALNAQRTAVGVISATTSEQISRSPDSDAAQAVRRVSGVTVQDGKYVFVRGLGERYTTTSLNGVRVPSPEPEKKVVPLDLFPANLLEAITTSKTFTPDQPGDFSGAQVNLRTKSFPARRMAQLSVSGSFNAQATGKDILSPSTTGMEWLGLAAGDRRLPASLGTVNFATLTQTDVNSLIRSLPSEWSFDRANAPPDASAHLSFGGEDPVLGHAFGYIGSLTYARGYEVHGDEIRARAVPADAAGTPKPYNTFVGSTGKSSVIWGGLFNLSTYLGRRSKIELDNTYDRTADNEAHLDWGTLEEFQQVDSVRRSSQRYVERTVRSSQLRGEHELDESNNVQWSLSSSAVSRIEPDRADLAYGYEFSPGGERLPLAWLGFIPEAAKRTSGELHEDVLAGDLDYSVSFGGAERATTIKVGGAYRHTERDAVTESYNLRALGLSPAQRVGTPEELFYGGYTEGSQARITIEPNNSGGSYGAIDRVSAGYAMAEIPLTPWLRLVGGARLEVWDLEMEAEPTSRALVLIERRNTDVLPSIALNAQVGENRTLRLSAARTLARPEYRELAPVSYRDMLGEREVFGDSSLVRTLVDNFDLRWEWYPDLDEVVSVGLFAKRFTDPIEPIDVATTGASQLSFINAESAFNYGVELEVRKKLEFLTEALAPFSVFSNVTLMRSRISTANSGLSALTNDDRPMVGQAPYVINAGLTYAMAESATSATLLYNVVGERITSAAVTPIAVDTYERPRHNLDLSVRFPLYSGMSAKLDLKNILDASYEELQGDVIRHSYSTGRALGFGVSWKTR